MDNKPLCKYDPLAYRSRNAVADYKAGAPNTSRIKFDHGLHVQERRQFYTTNSQTYLGNPAEPISNPGILSEKYVIARADREK